MEDAHCSVKRCRRAETAGSRCQAGTTQRQHTNTTQAVTAVTAQPVAIQGDAFHSPLERLRRNCRSVVFWSTIPAGTYFIHTDQIIIAGEN